MSEEVSVNALGALSSAVAPAVPGYGDKNAALTYAKATDAAKTMMARCLDRTVEGEPTISVVSPEMEINARRAATAAAGTDSAVASVSGASTVNVSNDVLRAQGGGGDTMDMKLLSMNFDPHALNQQLVLRLERRDRDVVTSRASAATSRSSCDTRASPRRSRSSCRPSARARRTWRYAIPRNRWSGSSRFAARDPGRTRARLEVRLDCFPYDPVRDVNAVP